MPNNYYSTLQVHIDAEQEIIEAAFRRLARKYHPDINKTSDATVKMQSINEAYEVLADSEKRIQYDQEFNQRNFDSDDIRRQLEIIEYQLLDEQIRREETEEELAYITRELGIEKSRRERAERRSLRLSNQLHEEREKTKQHQTPIPPSDATFIRAAHILLENKHSMVEKELSEERIYIKQIQGERSKLSVDLTEERNEREKANKEIARIKFQLAQEREQREKLEEEKRLAVYERHAYEKAEASRVAELEHNRILEEQAEFEHARCQAGPLLVKRELFEVMKEKTENELSLAREMLRNLAKELRNIFS